MLERSEVIQLSDYGTDLSSTQLASELGVYLLLYGGIVDCSGVRSMSWGFVRNLLKLPFVCNGELWFTEHIKITGYTDTLRSHILEVISTFPATYNSPINRTECP